MRARLETPTQPSAGGDGLATPGGQRVCDVAAAVAAVIRIDALWLALEPMDMRAGSQRLLSEGG